jgi:hypothetical protein
MKKLICALSLISSVSIFHSLALAGPLDSFAGSYTLQQGTSGMNVGGDLICPSPLIFRLSLSALDSNMPQLPVLQVAKLQSDTDRYEGDLSQDGTTFTYNDVTKLGCSFLGLFCSTSTTQGSLDLNNGSLTITHTESTSSDGVLSTGTCTYTAISNSPAN